MFSQFFVNRPRFAFVLAIALSLCGAGTMSHGATDGVKVSSFGFDAEDSTEIIQRALDSGARTLVFDRQAGP